MVRIRIRNMGCGGCAKGVRAALNGAAPGAAVEVDLAQREVRVDHPDSELLLQVLRAAGWEAQLAID